MRRARDCPSPIRSLFFIFALLACPLAARALDLDLKVEPGAALPLNKPQSQRFELGGAASLKGLIGYEGGYVDLAAGLTFVGLVAQPGYPSRSLGTAWAPSLGLRIQRPRETEERLRSSPHEPGPLYGARPWADGDILYVRTGGLDRLGFAAAAGVSFPIGASRSFWLGPFVRYFQIIQAEQAGVDTRDSRTLIAGLSLEFGERFVRPTIAEPVAVVDVAPQAVAIAAPACIPPPDRDADGVPDDIDTCPDVAGPASNGGCPIYEKLIIKPDRLELKEKIQFALNTGVIDPVSHPLLDEVAKALQENKGFQVTIEGHASSEGPEAHNQVLSDERASAVLEYIVNRGVARSRLGYTGFSSARPIESNDTESGREANRRVEFVVHLIVSKEESLP